jgi:tetratricopeptide (TPR) repeat protein
MEGALADARAALARDPANKLAGEVAAFAGASLRKHSFKHSFKEVKRPWLESIWGGSSEGGVPASSEARFRSQDRRPGGRDSVARPAAPVAGGLMKRASRRLGLGDFQGALLDVTRVLDARPSDPAAWALRARISNHLKNHAGALSDADQALRLDPKNAAALRERAYANYELGDYRLALTDADAAVRLEPSNATGYLYRAMIKEKLGRTEEALADFETAARLDPALRPLAEAAGRRLGRNSLFAADGGRLPNKASRYWFRGWQPCPRWP